MRLIAEVKERLRALLLGKREDRELEEELRFHLDKETEAHLDSGVGVEEARRRARVAFGGTERMKEEVRDARGVRPLADLGRDIRYALRTLGRSPAFVAVAVLTLALGIGANTAIFSVLNAVLLRPLPTPGLDRLVVMQADVPSLDMRKAAFSPLEVLDFAARDELFEAVTGFQSGDRTLTGYGDPVRITTAATLGDFRGVFAPRLHAGTFYRPEQSIEGPRQVAVVSYGLWQQLSGGDPSFIGATIELNGVAHEVVGVLDREFRYPRGVQVWVPFALTERFQTNRGIWIMTTVARLRPGISDARLAAQLDAETAHWSEEYFSGQLLHATGFVEHHAGQLRLVILVLMGAVTFVLLIAAANVGSLQLVRASGRGREIAVRGALGAGRFRIARQLLVESALLAAAGGAAGLLIGVATLRAFERWQPAQQMYLSEIPLDASVLGFTAAVVLIVATAFGTIPALRAMRVQPQEVLRESVRGSTAGVGRHRLLQASVVVQVALALVLLLGAGLMIRTLSGLLATDTGFDAENVLTAEVSIPLIAYDGPARRLAFFDELLTRARAIPGVEHAALISGLPFTKIDSSPFGIPGRPQRPGEAERHHEARVISSDYFRALRIPLLAGRSFDGSEQPPSGMGGGDRFIAVIDETFAAQFFPGENPVGQVITGYIGGDAPVTIIGVARRVDQREVGDAPKASAYYSYRQLRFQVLRTIIVRSLLPSANVVNALRSILADMDPNVPLYDVLPMQARVEQSLGPRRMAMLALVVFAGLSLLLATLGVYGIMRYTTNERTREIGIRMALGAAGGDVVKAVVRQAAAMIVAGVAIGIAAALIAARAIEGILFGVTASDPLSILASAAVLVAVALVASYLPAWRATRVDPMIALRVE